jgi:hypothetical protein
MELADERSNERPRVLVGRQRVHVVELGIAPRSELKAENCIRNNNGRQKLTYLDWPGHFRRQSCGATRHTESCRRVCGKE